MSDTPPAIQAVEVDPDPAQISLPPSRIESEILKKILENSESVKLQPYGVFGRASKNRVNDYLTPPYYGMESLPASASFGGNAALISITGTLELVADIPQIRNARMRNKVITDTKRDVQKSIGFFKDLLEKHPLDRYCELVKAEVDHREEILAWLDSERGRNRWDVRMGSFATASNGATLVNSAWQTATDS
jgi:hypothetical protein